MEGLFRLVAESFARHGLDTLPANDVPPAEPAPPFAEAPPIAVIPEHNYRQAAKSSLVP